MKTFTYKQAIEVLNKYFKGYRILKKFDGIRELSILFGMRTGKMGIAFNSRPLFSDSRGLCDYRGVIF